MKKIVLFVFVLINMGGLSAQLVVDGTDFKTAGTTLTYQNADPMWMLNQNVIETSGEDAVWNITDWQYTTEITENYVSIDTLSFLIQLVFNNQFTDAEHYSTAALPVDAGLIDLPIPLEISNGYSYSRTDETGFYNTGTSLEISGIPLATPNDTVEKIYQFPMQYGDAFNGVLSFFMSVPTLGAYGQHATRSSIVDGAGVLNTPYGSYEVLRVKAVRHITDTLFIEQFGIGQTINRPEQIDYAWISPEVSGPVLKMSVVAGEVVSAQLFLDSTSVSTPELSSTDFHIYPNPAHDFIYIETGKNHQTYNLTIYSLEGKKVLSQTANNLMLDISSLSPGMYVIQIKTHTNQTYSQKIRVSQD